MGINDWPPDKRPREKLLCHGPSALSDAELLAIFLRVGVRGKSALDLADSLLQEFGSLKSLLGSDRATFCKGHGLGDAKYVQLQAVLEISRRYLHEIIQRGDVLSNPDETRAYLIAQMRGYEFEVFSCLFLDSQNRIIKYEELFRGTIDSAAVYPREVVKKALEYGASGVIFAHNHPSGVAEPSTADRNLTDKLISALMLFDIRVLDHFIIGDGHPFSFAESGLL